MVVEELPHRVVVGMAQRAVVAVAVGHRGSPEVHHPKAPADGPLQLAQRPVDVRQAQIQGGEQALLVGEAPVVVEPAVEGPKSGGDGPYVVFQAGLHAHAQGGEHEAPAQPLGVHEGQALVAVSVGRADGVELAEGLAHVAGRGLGPEVLVEDAGLGHRVEGGVGDEPVDAPGHDQPLLAPDVGPLHAALGHLGVDVAGEGVGGLVVVVVGVESEILEVGHKPILACLLGKRPPARPEPGLDQ